MGATLGVATSIKGSRESALVRYHAEQRRDSSSHQRHDRGAPTAFSAWPSLVPPCRRKGRERMQRGSRRRPRGEVRTLVLRRDTETYTRLKYLSYFTNM